MFPWQNTDRERFPGHRTLGWNPSVAAVTTGYLLGGHKGNKLQEGLYHQLVGKETAEELRTKRHKDCCSGGGLGAVCDEASWVWFYVEYISTVTSVCRKGAGVWHQREVASSRAGVAGVVEREALLELLSFGLAETLTLPPPAPPVMLLWTARDKGPEGVLSEWVGGAPEDAKELEEDEEEGVPRGTPPPPGSPCRPWPQTWWCFSQSLCWQKEPQ